LVVRRSEAAIGFEPLPRRWVVERTIAWLNRNRRLAKDFEATIESAQAWLFIASVKLLSRRIASSLPQPSNYESDSQSSWQALVIAFTAAVGPSVPKVLTNCSSSGVRPSTTTPIAFLFHTSTVALSKLCTGLLSTLTNIRVVTPTSFAAAPI
jgi:hypothetical protein